MSAQPGQGKKRAALAGPLTAGYLRLFSKEALIDFAADLLARNHGEEPTDCELAELAEREIKTICRHRGDRMPHRKAGTP